jgi:hypothetical protein
MARLAEAMGTHRHRLRHGTRPGRQLRRRERPRPLPRPGREGASLAALTLIDPRGRQPARTVADANGAFRLHASVAGAFTLLASAAPHAPAASAVIVREPAAGNETVVNIHLADTGSTGGQG